MGAIIAYLALTLASLGYSEWVGSIGKSRSKRLTEIAKKIYSRIAENSDLLDSINQAYADKNNTLLTQLMQGAGFGVRSAAIQEAINAAKQQYLAKKSELNKQNAELQNAYNETTQASYSTGTQYGNIEANKVAKQMEQYINGGADNNAKISEKTQQVQ